MACGSLGGLVGHLRRIAANTAGAAARADDELVAAFLACRDEEAFAALVRRHGPMVLGVCRRLLDSPADADDAFQATFVVLARRAATIARRELLGNWLYGVACRTARKARAVRARRRGRERPLTDMDDPATTDRADGELRELLDVELGRLPEKYRVPLVLCELEGRSRRDAARALGVAEGTLSSRLSRGRQLLADRLTRRGLALSAAALTAALAQARAEALLLTSLVQGTARAAVAAAAGQNLVGLATTRALTLADGVLKMLAPTRLKVILVALIGLALWGALAYPRPEAAEQSSGTAPQPSPPKKAVARGRSVILLWMSGGPSQLDTFDLKPGNVNGGPFKDIETVAKGVRISEHLPKLARFTDRMVLFRALTHGEGDHLRATHLMSTGYTVLPGVAYPMIGAVLGKELGGEKPPMPNFVRVNPQALLGLPSEGYLGARWQPLMARFGANGLVPPELSALEAISEERAPVWITPTTEAFDLSREKEEVRRTYGENAFGQGCLLARRLVERGTPVVEVSLAGWDSHAKNFAIVAQRSRTSTPAGGR